MSGRMRIASVAAKAALSVVIVAYALLGCLSGCAGQQPQREADFSGVRSICELSVFRCYYHDVATVNVEASGPFADIFKTGYKRIWIEYSGTVDIGIDAGKVDVSKPDEQGVVKVHIPEVEILDVYLDKDSINTPVTDAGFLTEITAEEKMAGIAEAQDNMRETASQNQSLFTQAYDRARRMIAAYVTRVGDSIGKEYTVEFV